MKTLFKNFTLLLFTVLLSSNLFSQGVIWATVKDTYSLTNSEEWIALDAQYDLGISQALPSSKNARLQDVYEITCNCDDNDLYVKMVEMNGVKGVEFGPKYKSLTEPVDWNTYVNYSVPSNSPGHYSSWHLKLVNAQQAWNKSKGDSAIIAISDQNYWVNHEELAGKIVYYDSSNTASQGHGTAVAITAAGQTNNTPTAGPGIAGIGYNAKVALYRMNYNEVLDASYSGYRVVNLSWTSGCAFNQYIQDAINEVYNNGTFIVASAGNGSTCGDPEAFVYPAAFENVFAVSSVGADDSHYNNYGGGTHQHNETVDLMAPGYNVPISAAPGWYLFGSGTSYAAPMVAGTVGLMVSLDPELTNAEIEFILCETAADITAQNPDYIGQIGAGRLDAGYAVIQVQRNLDIEANGGTPVDTGDGEDNGNEGNEDYDQPIVLPPSKPGTYDQENVLKSIRMNNHKIINMMGQEVKSDNLMPGIYIIIKDGRRVQKLLVN